MVYLGALGVLIAYLLLAALGGNGDPRKCFEGADGRLSTSKFQFFVWTGAIVFAYTAIVFARASRGNHEVLADIPPHLLTVMGFSAATLAVAKGITVGYIGNNRLAKVGPDSTPSDSVLAIQAQMQPRRPKGRGLAGLVQDDDGVADLSKIQMLVWTAIAVGIFATALGSTVSTIIDPKAAPWPVPIGTPDPWPGLGLPDIDGSLMVLMGLSQGAYLGKKLTTLDQPKLTGVSRLAATTGDEVTLLGASLGDGTGSMLLFNEILLPAEITNWTDTEITFKGTSAQPAPLQGKLTVMIGGLESNPVSIVLS